MQGFPSDTSAAWAVRLARVPDRHRGVAFWQAHNTALWWCASGLADQALALGWDEVALFGVRDHHPFRGAPFHGAALTGVPRLLTDCAAYFADGLVIRRGQFGPDFIPMWCLDRRLRRPERHLLQVRSGFWAPANGWRVA